MKLAILAILSGLLSLVATGQPIVPIIPQPNQVKAGKSSFLLNKDVMIVSKDQNLLKQSLLLNQMLQETLGFSLQQGKVAYNGKPTLLLEKGDVAGKTAGSYEMEIEKSGIKIKARDEAGIFYGLNNLVQLIPFEKKGGNGVSIPSIYINDEPRFGYRGMMLDVARHFRSMGYLKRLLDQMALLKLNVFHWHLTEDQGWRIEIKKFPKLTETGAWRNGTIIGGYPGTGNDNLVHGGFYTQEQVKEIVRYADERHITIVPEIEMPGHSGAAIAAYPFLSCFPDEETLIPKHPSEKSKAFKGKKVQESWGVYEDVFVPSEQTFKFLEDVLDEIIPLFPGKYIHIGGDECPKEAWKRSAFCQELIREKGLKDEHGLQSYFIGRMEKHINSRGKQIIGWDEILEGGLAPNATVMSWRGEDGGIEAAKQHHEVVMTPTNYCYLDYSQTKNEDSVVIGGYLPLEKVYQFNPIPEALQGSGLEKYVIGAQANLWTEYIRENSKLEYMIYPRLAAMSENVWTNPGNKSWENFQEKLPPFFMLLDKLGINYSKAFFSIQSSIKPTQKFNGLQWELTSKLEGGSIQYTLPGTERLVTYHNPIPITSSGEYIATLMKGNSAVETLTQIFRLHKAAGRKVEVKNAPSKKYGGNGGIQGVVNGVTSNSGLKSAEWLGWEGGDMEAVIDLGSTMEISSVKVSVFESKGSWIYRPSDFAVFVSEDNQHFTQVGNGKKDEMQAVDLPRMLQAEFYPTIAVNRARYVKVVLKNFGIIPTGMPGASHPAWLFVDEIEVN